MLIAFYDEHYVPGTSRDIDAVITAQFVDEGYEPAVYRKEKLNLSPYGANILDEPTLFRGKEFGERIPVAHDTYNH